RRAHVVGRQPPLDPSSGQQRQREPGVGHAPALDPPLAAHEVERRGRVPAGHQGPPDGKAREDVAGRPAAGDDGERRHPWRAPPPGPRPPGRAASVPWRATFTRTPTAARVTTRDEPPKETNGSGTPVTGRRPVT